MSDLIVGKLTRVLLTILQTVAFAVFTGIAAYGVFTFWGGETRQTVSPGTSILLGVLAVACIGVVVFTGGIQDKLAVNKDKE